MANFLISHRSRFKNPNTERRLRRHLTPRRIWFPVGTVLVCRNTALCVYCMYLIRTIEEMERQTEMLDIGRSSYVFASSFDNDIRFSRTLPFSTFFLCFALFFFFFFLFFSQ